MIDLTSQNSTAIGILSKVTFAKDGKTNDSLVFDLQLVYELGSEQEADTADSILRGTRGYFDAYSDTEARGGLNVTPLDVSGNLRLIHEDDAVTVMDATVEIQKVDVKKASKVIQATVKVRVRGLDPSSASHFAQYLNKTMTTEWESGQLQQVLSFPTATGTNAVQVVTADDGNHGFVFGVQTGVDGDKIILDDFGTSVEVNKSDVVSKVILSPEHGADGPSLIEVVEPYAELMREGGVVPSWKYVIIGIAAGRDGALEGVSRVLESELKMAVDVALKTLVQP